MRVTTIITIAMSSVAFGHDHHHPWNELHNLKEECEDSVERFCEAEYKSRDLVSTAACLSSHQDQLERSCLRELVGVLPGTYQCAQEVMQLCPMDNMTSIAEGDIDSDDVAEEPPIAEELESETNGDDEGEEENDEEDEGDLDDDDDDNDDDDDDDDDGDEFERIRIGRLECLRTTVDPADLSETCQNGIALQKLLRPHQHNGEPQDAANVLAGPSFKEWDIDMDGFRWWHAVVGMAGLAALVAASVMMYRRHKARRTDASQPYTEYDHYDQSVASQSGQPVTPAYVVATHPVDITEPAVSAYPAVSPGYNRLQ